MILILFYFLLAGCDKCCHAHISQSLTIHNYCFYAGFHCKLLWLLEVFVWLQELAWSVRRAGQKCWGVSVSWSSLHPIINVSWRINIPTSTRLMGYNSKACSIPSLRGTQQDSSACSENLVTHLLLPSFPFLSQFSTVVLVFPEMKPPKTVGSCHVMTWSCHDLRACFGVVQPKYWLNYKH